MQTNDAWEKFQGSFYYNPRSGSGITKLAEPGVVNNWAEGVEFKTGMRFGSFPEQGVIILGIMKLGIMWSGVICL